MKLYMEKRILVSIITCTGLFSPFTFAELTNNSANIDITGTVIASPCVVNGNDISLSVNLGDTIQADSLSQSNSATKWKDITLSLTNCPASTSSFSVSFAGTADSDANYYKNTGTATNLKLELTDESSETAYKNGAKLENVAIPGTSHAYDLKMRARAVSNGGTMPGSIIGQVQATFTYQ